MDLNALLSRDFPSVNQGYGIEDTILYALGVGAGADPVNPRDLPFVYEEGLRIISSQATVLGRPGFWLSDPGIKVDWLKVLHGEESIKFVRPLKPIGAIRSEFRVIGVDDKGPEKGAIVYFEKQILDAEDNDVICVVRSTY